MVHGKHNWERFLNVFLTLFLHKILDDYERLHAKNTIFTETCSTHRFWKNSALLEQALRTNRFLRNSKDTSYLSSTISLTVSLFISIEKIAGRSEWTTDLWISFFSTRKHVILIKLIAFLQHFQRVDILFWSNVLQFKKKKHDSFHKVHLIS